MSSSTPESDHFKFGRSATATALRCSWVSGTCLGIPTPGTRLCSMHQQRQHISTSRSFPSSKQETTLSEVPGGNALSGPLKDRPAIKGKAARKTCPKPSSKPSPLANRVTSKDLDDLDSPKSTDTRDMFASPIRPPESPSQRTLSIKKDKLHRASASMSSARTNGVQPSLLSSNHNSPNGSVRAPIKSSGGFYQSLKGATRISRTDQLDGTSLENALGRSINQQHSTPRKPPTKARSTANGEHILGHTNGISGVKNGINGTNIPHAINRNGLIPKLPSTLISNGVHPREDARRSAPLESAPGANQSRRVQSTPLNRHSDGLKEWVDEQRDRDDTEFGKSFSPSRWTGQMSKTLSSTSKPQDVHNYVHQELSAREGMPVGTRQLPETQGTPIKKSSLRLGDVDLVRSAKPAVEQARQSSPKRNPYNPGEPPVEQERARRAENFNQVAFDSYIYNQEGASTPPGAILVPPPLPMSIDRDPPAFLHIDPTTHYNRPHSETWLKRKQRDIQARGSKKANFGKAAERAARQRHQEESVPLEEKMPDIVQGNPAWMRAQKWFASVDKEVKEGYKQQASVRMQRDQAAQIQEQLEREATRSSR